MKFSLVARRDLWHLRYPMVALGVGLIAIGAFFGATPGHHMAVRVTGVVLTLGGLFLIPNWLVFDAKH